MSEPLISLCGVSKSFGGVQALAGLSFTLRRGEIHCLAGENGSGKSTLIKIIAGIYRPDSGSVLIDGETIAQLDPITAIAHGIQVIYQDFSLFPTLTVAENLALPSEIHAGRRLVRWRHVHQLARAALARLGIDIDLAANVEALSTAERQLVAIARALMSAPRLLVMDEPTTTLTGREVERLFAIVRDIQRQGIAVLFVSHKIREMFDISERITVIRNGCVVAAGAIGEFNEAALARAMTGQEITAEGYRWMPPPGAKPRLEIRGLTVPGELQGIDLRVMPGEIIGISGLLGSGRTELALALFGLRPIHQGEIRVDGRAAALRSVQQAVSAGITYVPEDRLTEGLFLTQTINRNLLAASFEALSRYFLIDFARARRASANMIAEMQITTPSGERPVMELSGGNQQRVVIGRWLMRDARVLILNGPTVGVDVGSKAGIHRRIRDLAESRGVAVLMISDDLPELVQNCNRILILHRGKIVEEVMAEATTEAILSEILKALS